MLLCRFSIFWLSVFQFDCLFVYMSITILVKYFTPMGSFSFFKTPMYNLILYVYNYHGFENGNLCSPIFLLNNKFSYVKKRIDFMTMNFD